MASTRIARDWLTQAQVADTLGVTRKTVRRLITSGQLPAYRFGPRMVRIDATDLDNLARRIPAGEE